MLPTPFLPVAPAWSVCFLAREPPNASLSNCMSLLARTAPPSERSPPARVVTLRRLAAWRLGDAISKAQQESVESANHPASFGPGQRAMFARVPELQVGGAWGKPVAKPNTDLQPYSKRTPPPPSPLSARQSRCRPVAARPKGRTGQRGNPVSATHRAVCFLGSTRCLWLVLVSDRTPYTTRRRPRCTSTR